MAEKKIGLDTFRVEKMGARDSQRLLLRIGHIVGPGIAAFATALAGGAGDRDSGALVALGNLLTNADPEEADRLLVDLCEQAKVMVGDSKNYDQVIFGHHLDHDLQQAWALAAFVLEVNYKDFFDAAAGSPLGKAVARSAVSRPPRSPE